MRDNPDEIRPSVGGEGRERGRKLRVLLISHEHPELLRGGAQQACYELFLALRQEPDVEAYFLAAVDQAYASLRKPDACITGFDGRENEFLFLSAGYDYFWHRSTSARHVQAFAELLESIRPDVVHFQHFVRLGVDLVSLTRTLLPQCRIVFTFHDYLTMCAAHGQLVRRTDGSLCRQPSPVRCHQCFPDAAPELFAARKAWNARHLMVVDRYACVSRFQLELHVAWGIDRQKIFHIRNGQADHAYAGLPSVSDGPRNRFGFFGQLVDSKGVHVIFRAVRILRDQGFTNFTIELNGDNLRFATPTIRQEIEDFLAEEELRPPAERIVFNNGSYQVDQIGARMSRIDWTLVSSIWWEGSPLVISEAGMFRRPIIASNIGAMAERIDHDVNGLHFQVGDERSLAAVIRRAATEPGLWERLSEATPKPPSLDEGVKGYRALYEGA